MKTQKLSRRRFIKLAAAGLLAGCGVTQQPEPTPTSAPAAAPARTPTLTSEPTVALRQPEVIQKWPDVSSRVVHTSHGDVRDGETLVLESLRDMLDASITELTGLNDARQAWAALFDPAERIALKVNTIRNSAIYTHVPLVIAIADALQDAGVPAEQIVIFDRYTLELEEDDYPINPDGPGVRCHGDDFKYTESWTLGNNDIMLSPILLSCNALINVPVLKQHGMAGTSFAMKNHYGTFDKPGNYHSGMDRAIPELNDLPPIRDRTRLIVGDVLSIAKAGWRSAVTGDSILMSFDPVAHDAVGLQLYVEAMEAEGENTKASVDRTTPWLKHGTELGLGTHDPANMDLVRVTL